MSSKMTIKQIERELIKADRQWVSAHIRKDRAKMTTAEERFDYIYNLITGDQFSELTEKTVAVLESCGYEEDTYPFHEGWE